MISDKRRFKGADIDFEELPLHESNVIVAKNGRVIIEIEFSSFEDAYMTVVQALRKG